MERLKEKYKNEIQIYLGIEEDMHGQVNRADFDYIIGSSHYIRLGGHYYPLDLDHSNITDCLKLASALVGSKNTVCIHPSLLL